MAQTSPGTWSKRLSPSTVSNHHQNYSDVAQLADDRLIFVWTDWRRKDLNGNKADRADIYARIFDPVTGKWTDEILVASDTGGSQEIPTVVGLADGGFVVAWEDYNQDKEDSGLSTHTDSSIQARVFDSDGEPRAGAGGDPTGAEFLVNFVQVTNDQINPGVVAVPDGGFVVLWQNLEHNTIKGMHFGSDFQLPVNEPRVDSIKGSNTRSPDGAVMASGALVVVWADDSGPTGNGNVNYQWEIRARIFDNQGTDTDYVYDFSSASTEFVVNTTTFSVQSRPTVTALSDGGFVVVWSDYSGEGVVIRGQRFDAAGTAVAVDGTALGQSEDGEFMISDLAWAADDMFDPKVAGFETGGFVVVWQRQSDKKLFGRQYSDTGEAGDIFKVAGAKADYDHQITTLSDGRFMVSWTRLKGDENGKDELAARLFDPRTEAVNLLGTDEIDRYGGTAYDDTLAGMAGADILRGHQGNDILNGGEGDDVLRGDRGRDTVQYSTGNDIKISLGQSGRQQTGEGNDRLKSIENIETAGGNDQVSGDGGNNKIKTGAGDDFLKGGGGRDLLDGGAGSDTAFYSGKKGVRVDLRETGYQFTGNGKDKLVSIENLIGGRGADRLIGNEADNILVGLGGRDRLSGNEGADSFVFIEGDGRDVITDFEPGVDQLWFDSVLATEFDDLSITTKSGNMVIEFGDVDIILIGVDPGQIDPNDFFFGDPFLI